MATDEEIQAYNAALEAETTDGQSGETAEGAAPVQSEEPGDYFELFHEGKAMKFPATAELQFTHDGKPIKTPYSKLINTYRQASHLDDKFKTYAQQEAELRNKMQEFDDFQGLRDKYGAIQEWSEKNPEEFQRLWDLYQNKDRHLMSQQVNVDENPQFKPFIDEISNLKSQLGELTSFKQQFDKQQEEAQVQADTEFIKNEINEFSKAYPEIDLDEQDAEGVKLLGKIVQYGIQEKLPTFRAAALAYLEPRLLEIAQARASQSAVKTIQGERRQGIVAKSDTPLATSGQGSRKVDPRNMSWDDLAKASVEEYESLLSQG